MPKESACHLPVNTRILREIADGCPKPRLEFCDAVKKRGKTARCRANDEAGTGLANLHLPIGYAPSTVSALLFQHGGARNFASRTSESLPLLQAQKMVLSAQKAQAIGRPLNRHITVHWEAAGITDGEAMAATTAFLKYLREWLRGKHAYLWVRENGDGKGSHVHILAHIPDSKKLSGALSRRWVERCTGRTYRAGAIYSRKIAGSSGRDGKLYVENLKAVLAYVLKGVEPEAARELGIKHQYGGRVIGKRCGTSRNIG